MLIAGNWKMNTTRPEAVALAESIVRSHRETGGLTVVVCPPAVSLDAVGQIVEGSGVRLGAQNVHREESGAFTGEVSAGMLRSVGCRYVIVGHSERRQYFGETDDAVNAKVHQAIAHGLVPIACVGEQATERKEGRAEAVVRQQVEGVLAGVSLSDATGIVFAYEPVWAIGTGVTASPEEAQAMHAVIRSMVVERFGETGRAVELLYGGSMKPENARELLQQPDVTGGLIGGASLKSDQFISLIRTAANVVS
jgi:triosephosphate isomerase